MKKRSGALIRQHTKDNPPYQVDTTRYKRFDQKNDMYCRPSWDDTLAGSMMEEGRANAVRKLKPDSTGLTRLEFALYTAAWTVGTTLGSISGTIGAAHRGLYAIDSLDNSFQAYNGLFDEFDPWLPDNLTAEQMATLIKRAGVLYGAGLVGIAELDERWVYSYSYGNPMTHDMTTLGRHAPIVFEDIPKPIEREDGTLVIPTRMRRVIVIALPTDYEAIATSHSAVDSAGIGMGYSKMAFLAGTMAEFIRGLGYDAVPCGNNTALSVPMALDAGLGEAGRIGLVITPEYGPRFRLAKIITDLPVAADGPISFGVTEFCEVCGKCAKHCPGQAIPKGPNARTFDVPNFSSNPGVYKWQVNAEKCYQVWVNAGHDCANCLRSCPFNKPDSWYHRMTMTLVGLRLPLLNRMILWIDDTFGFGKRKPSGFFWHLDVKPAKRTAVGGKPSPDQKEIQSTTAANVATPQDVFDRIQRKLEGNASKGGTQTASYQFDVTGENGGKWFVVLDGDQFQVAKGELPNAACKIKVSDMDLVALATGKLSGPKAVARGRVEMQGQIKLALKLDSLLS